MVKLRRRGRACCTQGSTKAVQRQYKGSTKGTLSEAAGRQEERPGRKRAAPCLGPEASGEHAEVTRLRGQQQGRLRV